MFLPGFVRTDHGIQAKNPSRKVQPTGYRNKKGGAIVAIRLEFRVALPSITLPRSPRSY